MSAILALHGVSKSYGALRVTDDITLSVTAGETLGILGPNGAGKTTLFNLISGDVRTDAGRVEFDGRDVTREPPHRRCRLGIGRSYQIPQPFGAMTVFENLAFPLEVRGMHGLDDALGLRLHFPGEVGVHHVLAFHGRREGRLVRPVGRVGRRQGAHPAPF